MTRFIKCALSIFAVAVVLGLLIFWVTRPPSPAALFIEEHPYSFSESKEVFEETCDSYVKNDGCIFLSLPEIDEEDTAAIIDQFQEAAFARFQAFTQKSTAPSDQIPCLMLDYTAKDHGNYIAMQLSSSLGQYSADGKGTPTELQEKLLYLNKEGQVLSLAELLGAEKKEKLDLILKRHQLSDKIESFTYSKEQVVLKWAEEERTFTMAEIERAGKIDPDLPMIAFTFDDGPGKYTKQFSDLLARYNGHGTFFMLGINVKHYKESVQYAHELGHEIASHTMGHKHLNQLSSSHVQKEINDADQAIQAITGEKPALVRPPYGEANTFVQSAINRPIVLWNLDTNDWQTRNAEAVKEAILKDVSDGSIILMHEIYESSYDGLALALEELAKDGYQFVSVSELMKYRQITPEVKTYFSISKK